MDIVGSVGTRGRVVARVLAGPVLGIALAVLMLLSPSAAYASPTVPDLDPSSDTGRSNTDNITSNTTPVFTGTAAVGAVTVTATFGGLVSTCVTATDAVGFWVADFSACAGAAPLAPDGTWIVKATDGIGPSVDGLAVTIDTTLPAAPTAVGAAGAPRLSASSDTGSSSSDNITRINTVTVLGEADPLAAVRALRNPPGDNAILASTVADTAGSWTLSIGPLADGTYPNISFEAEDLSGNISVLSGALATSSGGAASLVIDTDPPDPTVDLDASDDLGFSSTDNITSVTAGLTFNVTGEPLATAQLKMDGTTTGMPAAAAIGAGGTVSFTVVGPIAVGVHQFHVDVTDLAGNVSESGNLAVTIDTLAPATPAAPVLAAGSDSGAADNVTNVTSPVVRGTVEALAIVDIIVDGGVTGCSTQADGLGLYFCQLSLASRPALAYSLTARAFDLAGNTVGVSPALSVTVDTALPDPTLDLQAASDSGQSSIDNITNVTTPTFDLTGESLAGNTYVILRNSAAVTVAAAVPAGVFTFTEPGALAPGVYEYAIKVTDLAGNSSTSAVVQVTIDTAAPAVPGTPALAAGSDSGTLGDGITNLTTVTVTGFSGEPGATVHILVNGPIVCATTADVFGDYYCQLTLAGSAAPYLVTAGQTDVAGNPSAGASLPFLLTIDNLAPDPSVDLDAASDSGRSSTDNVTSDNSPSFTVTGEPGATAQLKINGTTTGMPASAVIPAGGSVAFAVVGPIADGVQQFSVTVTDVANNVTNSLPLQVTIDTAAPALPPAAPVLSPSSDSGTLGDGITNINNPMIRGGAGAVEGNALVRLFDGVNQICQTIALADGSYECPVTPLTAGLHSITATQQDLAGNTTGASAPLALTIDSTAPGIAPTIDLQATSDTGTSSTDNVTTDITPTFDLTGDSSAGNTYRIKVDGVFVTAAAPVPAGVFTFTSAALANGSHSVSIEVTDAGGDVQSAAMFVTIDTVPPAAPPAPALAAGSDSGILGDGITNLTTINVVGTAEPGAIVDILVGGTINCTTTADGGGVYSCQLTLATGGPYAITARQVDVAGNVGAAGAAFLLTIDAIPPDPTVDLVAASDSGRSSTDNVTSDNSPTFTVTGEPGATAQLKMDGTTTGMPAAAVIPAGGSVSFTVAGPVADGVHQFHVTVTDPAGNVTNSAALEVTIDIAAPAAPPAVPVLSPSSDSGVVGDGITTINDPMIRGLAGAVEGNALVRLFDGVNQICQTIALADGSYECQVTPLTVGLHSITATQQDLAGNTTGASAPLALTIDSTAPGIPPTIDLQAASDTGASNTDNITSDTTPTFDLTGDSSPGHTYVIKVNGVVVFGPAPVPVAQPFTFTSGALADGTYSVSIEVTDAGGDVQSASIFVTIDTTPPAAPAAAPVLSPSSDSGTVGDNLTNINNPSVLGGPGSVPANSRVLVYDGLGGSPTLVCQTTSLSDGSYNCPIAGPLTDGVHDLRVAVEDAAGNRSALSAVLTLTIDTLEPDPTVDLVAASDTGFSNTDNVTSMNGSVARPMTIRVTGEPGATAQLKLNGSAAAMPAAAVIPIAGPLMGIVDFTLAGVGIADGVHQFHVTVTDLALNVTNSNPLQVTIDTAAPGLLLAPTLAPASDSGTPGDNRTNITSPLVTGNAEPFALVTVLVDGVANCNTQADNSGAYSCQLTLTHRTLAYGVTVQQEDLAGSPNAGPSPALSLFIDTVAPDPTIDLVAASDTGVSNTDNITSNTSLVFQTTAEVGATVQVKRNSVAVGAPFVSTGTDTTPALGPFAEGVHQFHITVTDAAGNVTDSAAIQVTIDATAPGPPSAPDLLAASDSGALATDNVTNVASPTFVGTAPPLVNVRVFRLGGGQTLCTTQSDAAGNWQCQSVQLADGSYADVVAATSDAAGNGVGNSAALAPALVIDTINPDPTIDLQAGSDTGISNTDNVTTDTTPTFDLTGEFAVGNTYVILRNSNPITAPAAVPPVQPFTFAEVVPLAPAVYQYAIRVTDLAGNVSVSAALQVTIITPGPLVAPATAPDLEANSDSGTSNSDNVTNVNAPTFSGSAGAANAGLTVQIFAQRTLPLPVGPNEKVCETTADGAGNYTCIPNAAMADGTYNVTAVVADQFGNVSPASPALSITIDTVLPDPTIDLQAASDSGSSSEDNITNDTTPTFDLTGESAAGNTFVVLRNSAAITAPAAVPAGVFTFTDLLAPVNAASKYAIRVTDLAGNVSISHELQVTIDTVAPVAPAPPALATFSDTGVVGDGITNINAPAFLGGPAAVEANARVRIFADGAAVGSVNQLACETVATATGSYECTVEPLAPDTYAITAVQEDAAGNVSAPSAAFVSATGGPLVILPAGGTLEEPTIDLQSASDSGFSGTDNITNDDTPTFDLTADCGAGQTYVIKDGTNVIFGPAPVPGAPPCPVFTFTAPAQANGVHQYSIEVFDAAGNRIQSHILQVTIDTVAPAQPAVTDLLDASDDGPSSTDNITSVTQPAFRNPPGSSVEPSNRVRVFATTGGVSNVVCQTVATAAGDYECTVEPLRDGTYNIEVVQEDAAGNVSANSIALVVVIDSLVQAPTMDLVPASDTGRSNSDNVTSDNTPTFDLTAESTAGSVFLIKDGNLVIVAAAPVPVLQPFSVTLGAQADGDHHYSIEVIDRAGNVRQSAILQVTIDTLVPAIPAQPDMLATSDTGSSNTDNITAIHAPAFQGTVEPNARVRIFADGLLVCQTVATAAGDYECTVEPLNDGAHNITAVQEDLAGNVSPLSTALAITIIAQNDPQLPTLDLRATSDSGKSNTDNITNDSTPTLDGTAQAGTTVAIKDGNTVIANPALVGTTFTITLGALSDGTHILTAESTDAAGNRVQSEALVLVIDTVAPPTPTFAPDMLATSDTGTSNTDNLTSINQPAFRPDPTEPAINLEPNARIRVFAGTLLVCQTDATPTGAWECTVEPLTNGAHAITYELEDVAGNVSGRSQALAITVDSTNPQLPTLDLQAASDTGKSNTDNITRAPNPLFFDGTAENNAAGVTVLIKDGNTQIDTFALIGSSTFTRSLNLAEGTHLLTVEVIDNAGNIRQSEVLQVIVDRTAPAAPSAPDMLASSDTGVSSTDNVTSIHNPAFSGTSEANAKIRIFANGLEVCAVTASSSGTWECTVEPLTDGVYSITATAEDVAGNISAASAALTGVTIDSQAIPTLPTIDLLASSDSGISQTDNITGSPNPLQFELTYEAGLARLEVLDGNTVILTILNPAGTSQVVGLNLAEGTHSLSVRVFDVAGNSRQGEILLVIVDRTAPAAGSAPDLLASSDSGPSNTDNITRINTPAFQGTGEPNARIFVFSGTEEVCKTKVNPDGTWECTTEPLDDGEQVITVRFMDAAGNTSAASPGLTIDVDFTAGTGTQMFTKRIRLTADPVVKRKTVVAATVDIHNVQGGPVPKASVFVRLTLPNGKGLEKHARTNNEGRALLIFKVTSGSGNYVARVIKVQAAGSIRRVFVPSAADTSPTLVVP